MLVAAVVVTPIAGSSAAPAFADPVAVAAGIGVGLASSVIPYVSDQLAMARLSRATYSLMVALLPATATVVGVVVLAQVPTTIELAGVVLVVAAMAAHPGALAGKGRLGSVRAFSAVLVLEAHDVVQVVRRDLEHEWCPRAP